MATFTVGGVTLPDPIFLRREVPVETFVGALEDMPFFTKYLASFLAPIQERLRLIGLPPLHLIRAIRYADKYDPRRLLVRWIAHSEDQTVGWYKYAGLVAGGTRHQLVYDGHMRRCPGRRLTYPRRRRREPTRN
jgi:hypothetical protein